MNVRIPINYRYLRELLFSVAVLLLILGASLEPLEAQSCIVTTPIGSNDEEGRALVVQPECGIR
jgi:hypothetical protein